MDAQTRPVFNQFDAIHEFVSDKRHKTGYLFFILEFIIKGMKYTNHKLYTDIHDFVNEYK